MEGWVVLIFVLVSFVLFCCVRLGAEADRKIEKMFEENDNSNTVGNDEETT